MIEQILGLGVATILFVGAALFIAGLLWIGLKHIQN